MTTATETDLLTAEDLLRFSSEGLRGELIRGVLCEMAPAGTRHSRIAIRLGARLLDFAEPRGLGTVTGADHGIRLERDPDTVRAPDAAFFSAATMPPDADIPGYAEAVPDLVAEVRSPNDSRYEVHDKARMWLTYGVRLVWVVEPVDRTVQVHRPDHPVETLADDAALDGLDVLPGFTCPLSALFGG